MVSTIGWVALMAVSVGAIVWGVELFAEHLAAASARLGVSAFALALLLAGAEPEELATVVTASARGVDGVAYALAETLDTTMSELLGKRLLNEPVAEVEIDPTLAAFARKKGLPATEIRQLASIQWRGDPPQSEERWGFIHNALKVSRSLDA